MNWPIDNEPCRVIDRKFHISIPVKITESLEFKGFVYAYYKKK